jgi:hypothetical protein
MGIGYYQPVVQWSRGEYTGANNVQDDYAVMQSNGLPLRNDDHGNTLASASVLIGAASGGMTTTSAQGVIERPTDVDLFAFSAGAGTATFKVTPAARSTNLDAWVGLRDAAGNLLANINPVDALNAIVTSPAGGRYLLPVGSGHRQGRPADHGLQRLARSVRGQRRFFTPGSQPPTSVISVHAARSGATGHGASGASRDPDGSPGP